MTENRYSWIWKEAEKIAERNKQVAVLEAGFGPSGLPHIGTFQEVARTCMVRKAYETLTGKKVRVIVFADDLDGLRKVPGNIPNGEILKPFIGYTITRVPNPFGTEEKSFGEHNYKKMISFLRTYGFDIEFMCSSEVYASGIFNETILKLAAKAQEVKDIVTEDYGNLGSERKDTYCPFIPIDPETGKQTFNMREWKIDGEYMEYVDMDSDVIHRTSLLNGNVKCQWKVDWPLRWIALGVDWESHSKDLMSSAEIGHNICKLLNAPETITYKYELYLDEQGAKISKSKGNGISFEDWLKYAPADSLQWFIYQNPQKARKLYLEIIPQTVDSLIKELDSEIHESTAAWSIYNGTYPKTGGITYQMLLNLVNIADTEDTEIVWKYLKNYLPDISKESYPFVDSLIIGAINYYKDKVAPFKTYKTPTEKDKEVLSDLATALLIAQGDQPQEIFGRELAEYYMFFVYEVGKKHFGNNKDALRDDFFKMLYQVLMGQETGPRFGQFAVVYGIQKTIELINSKISK